MNADLALAVASALTGAVAMLIFRATSDQARIRTTRDAITGHVLEMRVYQDDLVLILKALGAALAGNLRYLRLVLVPLLAIAVVVAVVFVQLDARFSRAPLEAHQAAMVTVTYAAGIDVMTAAIDLEAGDGAVVDGPRVRVPARREVNWRVRAERRGTPTVTARVGSARYPFALAAAPGTRVVGDRRSRSRLDAMFHPGLPALPDRLPIERVEIRYPPARHSLFGWRTHWLMVFVFWSLVGALVPMRLLRIAV